MSAFAFSFQRRGLLAAVLGLLLSLEALPASAQLTLQRTQDLGFGGVVAGGGAGSVTVSPDGSRVALGDVALGPALGARAARFAVTGDPYLSFSILLPASAQLDAGGASLQIDQFTSLPAGSSQLDETGSAEIVIGARLLIAGSQPSDAYAGTFDVTVVHE